MLSTIAEKPEFTKMAEDFHQTLHSLGFNDDPSFAGICRFFKPIKDASINVGALTPPVSGVVGIADNPRFHIRIVKVRGHGRGGLVLGEWRFETDSLDGVPELLRRATFRVLIELGFCPTLCENCGGEGFTKSIWRPGNPILDGGFKRCKVCKGTGERSYTEENV
jgi:hypothetical protein